MKKTQIFSVVYEDKHIIALNKSSGISVSPDRFDRGKKNLFNVASESTGHRLWIVHRIDSGTSGLVVFAKDPRTHQKLSTAFENRSIQKTYITVVNGRPVWKEQVCDLPLVPNGNKKHQTIVDRYQGKKSKTNFKVLCTAGNYSVLEVKPESGRTHQIRVHAAALGHSVLCDPIYGTSNPVYLSSFKKNWRGDRIDEKPLLERLALHAFKLQLPNYGFGIKNLEAPLARDMSALIAQMEKTGKRYCDQMQDESADESTTESFEPSPAATL